MATIKITDLNREGGIGANSYHVEFGPWRFVVDTGLHPKFAGYEALPTYSQIPCRKENFSHWSGVKTQFSSNDVG